MNSVRNLMSLAFAFAVVAGTIGTVQAEDTPRVSRHTYRSPNAGPVAQLASAGQNVAPSRVVKAQPLIGNAALVDHLSTQSTRQLSASGVDARVNQPVPTANAAQPLVVNPVAHTTHAQVVTNPYANAQQPTVYTTYTNYGHPSSYTVQTGYTPTYTTYTPTYTRSYTTSYRSFPTYSSSYYCAPVYRSYPVYTHYRSHYYRRPSIHVGHHYRHYSHGNHYGHRSRGHIGYRSSGLSIGFSFGRGYGYCR